MGQSCCPGSAVHCVAEADIAVEACEAHQEEFGSLGGPLDTRRFPLSDSGSSSTASSVDEFALKEWKRVQPVTLVVRSLGGEEVFRDATGCFHMPVEQLINSVCAKTGVDPDRVNLLSGATLLQTGTRLGESLDPPSTGSIEITLVRVPGPPVTVAATSGRPIQVLDTVPTVGSFCHFDRNYVFRDLGGFANLPNTRYILTSNEDRKTPAYSVMWTLEFRVPATVHINLRSDRHEARVASWLKKDGWTRSDIHSTLSTGIPHGPYSGPVFSKRVDDGVLELKGSNFHEARDTHVAFVSWFVC